MNKISFSGIQKVEYNGERVMTTVELAKRYNTTPDNLSYNFNYNKDRYTLGKHYHYLTGDALRSFLANLEVQGLPSNTNRLYLWTEKGAMLHAKSLKTDEAWATCAWLIDEYFRLRDRERIAQLENENQRLLIKQSDEASLVSLARNLLAAENTASMSFKDYVKVHELRYKGKPIGRNNFMWMLRLHGFLCKNNTPTQKATDLGVLKQFRKSRIDNNGVVRIWYTTHVTPKGEIYFKDWLTKLEATTEYIMIYE